MIVYILPIIIDHLGGEADQWSDPSFILVCTQFRSSICKPTVIKIQLQLFQMKYLLLNTISMELRCPFSIHKQINSWAIPTGNNSTGFVPCLLFHGYVILKRSHGRFESLQDKGIVGNHLHLRPLFSPTIVFSDQGISDQ